jgi:hypothetical protein
MNDLISLSVIVLISHVEAAMGEFDSVSGKAIQCSRYHVAESVSISRPTDFGQGVEDESERAW